MTFIELLLAAKEGSASAFEILFDRYKNLLRKYSVITECLMMIFTKNNV